MRIALIGNMNNNNFSLMRYFRDLGMDAHLFLFNNDGKNDLEHFRPECDTWEIQKWSKFIHQTEFDNSPISILPFPYAHMLYLNEIIRGRKTLPIYHAFPSERKIRNTFQGFDILMGSGVAPALLYGAGLKLDGFYPYSIGIEFAGTLPIKGDIMRSSGIKRALLKCSQNRQINGIRNTRICFNPDQGLTKNTFDELGIKYIPLAVPMVYNLEKTNKADMPEQISDILKEMQSSDLNIISHGRQMWVNPGEHNDDEWERLSKHNDWTLKAFSEFVKIRTDLKSLLILAEYGQDITASKKLACELGITSYVRWLPVLQRRVLMKIIEKCHIGVGEFYIDHGVIWGGTGWEILASGIPLIQGFNFEPGEFQDIYGYPEPPLLPVRKEADILSHLHFLAENPDSRLQIGYNSLEWFNKNNGIDLAKKYLEYLLS